MTIAIGIAYPAFMSFLALETKRTDDDKKWLTYWVSFGAFNIIDHFTNFITRYIPFYLTMKVLFLIWMMHSATEGALTIYNNFILPYVEKYETEIQEAEKQIMKARKKLQDVADKIEDVAEDAIDTAKKTFD